MSSETRIRRLIAIAIFSTLALAARAYAIDISNVVISNVTDSSAQISWDTDMNTDALINYGLDTSVGIVRDSAFSNKAHTLTIENLDPSTQYFFRVVSSDEGGNKNTTAGFVFTTRGTQSQKINNQIKKITDPTELKKIQEALQQQESAVLNPPAIVGAPKVVAGSDTAVVTWKTDRESSSAVHLVPDGEYDPNTSDPYTMVQGDPGESVTSHHVDVVGLEPATTYHFKVTSTDSFGLIGETEDDTFATKAFLPTIQNPRVSRIQENSAVVTWSTGEVKARGLVSFTNMRTKKTQSIGNPIYTTNQSVTLTGLEFGTRYSAVITATNESGDNVDSKPLVFVTVRDVVPPQISKVNNTSTLFPQDDAKVQTIISWTTDEPAYCQVFYTQGLVKKTDGTSDSLQPEANPVADHLQVIVGFAPGSVYKFWMKCHDESQNETTSDDYVLITPTKEQSIIDLILANFQGTFGWLGNINKH